MRRISIGRSLRTGALVGLLVALACLPAMAQPAAGGGSGAQARGEQPVYGSDLMTQQERTQYRARLDSAQTEQEREQIRQEHHARMTERARERGVTLPEQPGVGAGPGPGPGAGPGRGAGPGSGAGGTGGRGGGRGH